MMEYACGWNGCSKDTLRAAGDRQCDKLVAQQRARVGALSPFGWSNPAKVAFFSVTSYRIVEWQWCMDVIGLRAVSAPDQKASSLFKLLKDVCADVGVDLMADGVDGLDEETWRTLSTVSGASCQGQTLGQGVPRQGER
jgi:hypothetical protein